jgi:TM2 domain-containing membrane protein YozV
MILILALFFEGIKLLRKILLKNRVVVNGFYLLGRQERIVMICILVCWFGLFFFTLSDKWAMLRRTWEKQNA